MKYEILYTKSYNKKAHKFFKKHKDILNQYQKTLEILEIDPTHPSLRLHKLSNNLSTLYSVSINISYRITIEFYIENKTIIPINIGTHDEVYK